MSNNNFDEVLTSLENVQDSKKLLKLLIDIRKKVDADCLGNNIGKIREKGAFKHIVSSLQTSNTSIINVSLSILGNCCLNAQCSRDVVCIVHFKKNDIADDSKYLLVKFFGGCFYKCQSRAFF